jgi:hypothetical protein
MSINKVNVNDTFHFDLEGSVSHAVRVETNKFHILHENTPFQADHHSDFLQN